ncbi:MAG: hypothetical protein IJM97_06885 [Clostridia bacterium]|nr:hypothetical protein [Clostridia bacterium]
MKNYKEMADSALNRIHEYEIKREKRKKVITQVSTVVGCVCIALILTVFLSQSDMFNDITLTAVQSSDIGETKENTSTSTTVPTTENALYTQTTPTEKQISKKNNSVTERTTKLITKTTKWAVPQIPVTTLNLEDWLSNDHVVWSDSGLKGSIDFATPIEKGSIAMTKELRDTLDAYGDHRFYAVMVSFESALPEDYLENIICDGKSITELEKKADSLLKSGKNEDAHKIYVEIKEAKREYLLNYIENFRDTFLKNGMRIFTESNGTTIDNMVFYCFASKISIENFKCKEDEAFYFTLASSFK